MKKFMIAFLILPIFLCGCINNNRNDIENTTLIRIFGIDKTDEGFEVTILYDASSSDEDKNFQVVSAEAKTVYEAYEKTKQKCDQQATLSQTKFFLVGIDACKYNIEQSINFVARHQAIKMDSMVLTLKDKSAKSILEKAKDSKVFLGDTLKNMQKKEKKIVEHENNTIARLLERITEYQATFILPNLNTDEDIPYIDGYNVFKNMQIVDTLNEKTSMGVDLFSGNVKVSSVYIEDKLGLIITNIESKLNLSVINNRIKITVNTNFITAIREVLIDDRNLKIMTLMDFCDEQNKYIDNLMQHAINYGKETSYDILGIKEISKKVTGNEMNIDYNNIDFVLNTKSLITKTFDIERK